MVETLLSKIIEIVHKAENVEETHQKVSEIDTSNMDYNERVVLAAVLILIRRSDNTEEIYADIEEMAKGCR